MKKIILILLTLTSLSIPLLAQEKAIPSADLGSFQWNQKIKKAEKHPYGFNQSFSKFAQEINPEFVPNTHLGLKMNKGVQFGLLVKF